MDALFSWPFLAVAGVILVVILLALRTLSRIGFSFRFRGAVTVSPWNQKPCPHLGLLDDPFIHKDEPDEDHRCYLWMQRDRIDLTHQKGFCLTSAHTRCPWLSIAPPVAKPPLTERVKTDVMAMATSVASLTLKALEALLVWLIQKAKGASPSSASSFSELAGSLLKVGARGALSLAVLAANRAVPVSVAVAKASGRASVTAARVLYVKFRALQTRSARQPEPVAEAMAPQSLAAASAASAVDPLLEVTSAPAPPTALELPTPAPKSATTRSRRAPKEIAEAIVVARPAPAPAPTNHIESLMEQGKNAGMGGNRRLAYSIFSMVIELEPQNDEAWLWKGAMADSPEEKLACFQQALAINPNNSRAEQALQQMSQEPLDVPAKPKRRARADGQIAASRKTKPNVAPDTLTTEDALVEAALAALEAGDEDRAYRFFVSATEMNPSSEKAWFWRAKAAGTLDEVIYSLQQALAINPSNEKVRTNLLWAIQRQQKEQKTEEAKAQVQTAAEAMVEEQPRPRRSLVPAVFRWLAALSCLALAGYWVLVAFLPLLSTPALSVQGTDGAEPGPIRQLYEIGSRWLPALNWSTIPGSEQLQVSSGYNLLAAVPYTVGFLYLFVAIGLFRREGWSRYWGLVITLLSLAMGVTLSESSQAAVMITGLGLATVLMLLISWRDFRHDEQAPVARRGSRQGSWSK